MSDAWAPPRLPEPSARSRDQTIARLGAGGMAEVFLIRRTGPGGFEKFLALKRIRAGLDAATYAPMLADEARLVAALQHPNIVQVHDAGADDDGLWFLMEYVHGRSLNAIIVRAIERGVAIPLECAAYVAACIGRALHYAHHAESATQGRLGVIHRDVSPGNILVGYDGVVKLADFGIARASVRRAETQDGTFKGKYGYAAPEQCRGEPLDGASDMFSLGTVLHELVTLRHLFSGESPYHTVQAVLFNDIPSLRSLRPDVPEELDLLVTRMLARDRAARFASGAETANALDALAHRLGISATRERMAELMAQLFTPAEMRLQLPPPDLDAHEAVDLPLRASVSGTPAAPGELSVVTSFEWSSAGAAVGSKAGAAAEPGSMRRELASASQAGSTVDGPERTGPSRLTSWSRVIVAAAVGAIGAIAVTLVLRRAPAVGAQAAEDAPLEPRAGTTDAAPPLPTTARGAAGAGAADRGREQTDASTAPQAGTPGDPTSDERAPTVIAPPVPPAAASDVTTAPPGPSEPPLPTSTSAGAATPARDAGKRSRSKGSGKSSRGKPPPSPKPPVGGDPLLERDW